MNLRLWYRLGIIMIATLQADCVLVPDCKINSCQPNVGLRSWCATSKACRVNGQLITTCGDGSDCPFDMILPGTHYEVPLDKLWPELKGRNDLEFRWKRDFKEESNVAVFLDDVQATEDVCQRKTDPYDNYFFYVRCPNLPDSVARLEFDFIPPTDGSSGDIGMSVWMQDTECVEANVGQCN